MPNASHVSEITNYLPRFKQFDQKKSEFVLSSQSCSGLPLSLCCAWKVLHACCTFSRASRTSSLGGDTTCARVSLTTGPSRPSPNSSCDNGACWEELPSIKLQWFVSKVFLRLKYQCGCSECEIFHSFNPSRQNGVPGQLQDNL